MTAERPVAETCESVYSNFDHQLDSDVVRELSAAPGELCAQHAAYSFCGYVWMLPDGRWVDQVWRYRTPVADYVGDTIEAVIAEANDNHGYE
ncbi:hypothetical protein [Nocardia wallacei]|uniref:hypothetical protein n=1 Tax=Nocardia wallacei TaxID=480035 RepID=UPI002454CC5A|nr:hypothetical protein [Nocardia wallacei]